MINDAKLQGILKWTPHKGQQEILKSESREVVICAGRRFGKSAVCGYIVAKTFLEGLSDIRQKKRDSVKIWIVAPTYDLAGKVFEYVVKFLQAFDKRMLSYVRDRPPQLKVSESIWIQCKSADEPRSLLGEELDLLVIDEAAQISKTIWFDKLQPATTAKSRECKTIFISTPVGKNWFYDIYMQAKETGGAFHFSSLDGVVMSQEKWDELKKKSPTDWFQQNYEATFLEKASAVFRNVIEANFPADLAPNPPYTLAEPRSGGRYVGGLDLAQINDFTVLRIFDYFTHKEVYFDRFNKILYPLQWDRIEKACRKYGAKLLVEINNVGLATAQELRARGMNIEDFSTQGTVSKDMEKKGTKERLINKLAVDIESHNIHIAPVVVSNDELEAYTHILSPAGNISYGAPEGMHDDCVMSLALANWGLMGKQRQVNAEIAQAMPQQKKRFQYF